MLDSECDPSQRGIVRREKAIFRCSPRRLMPMRKVEVHRWRPSLTPEDPSLHAQSRRHIDLLPLESSTALDNGARSVFSSWTSAPSINCSVLLVLDALSLPLGFVLFLFVPALSRSLWKTVAPVSVDAWHGCGLRLSVFCPLNGVVVVRHLCPTTTTFCITPRLDALSWDPK